MGDREPQLLRVLARKGDDLRQLLGRELTGAAAAVLVCEHVPEHRFQLLVPNLGRAGRAQPLLGASPPSSPAAYPLLVHAEQACLVGAGLGFSRPQHHLDAFRQTPLDRT